MIPQYRPPSFPVPPIKRQNLSDRYGLRDMEVGDQKMFFIPANHLSPYCSYLKKIGVGKYRTIKCVVEGRVGTVIERQK